MPVPPRKTVSGAEVWDDAGDRERVRRPAERSIAMHVGLLRSTKRAFNAVSVPAHDGQEDFLKTQIAVT